MNGLKMPLRHSIGPTMHMASMHCNGTSIVDPSGRSKR